MPNVVEVIIKATDQGSPVVDSFSTKLGSIGNKISGAGQKLTAIMAPAAIGLGLAVNSSLDFDRSMTNVGAVLGKNRTEMANLRAQILATGTASRAGPQATADAFYDIVGGVTDATTHMAILDAAILTSEAGASDLGATTGALISVMNSYGFSAEEAGYASDVLTRTVATGVGSMDEFAAAMPSITGLANSMGISFGDVGSMMAYLTTQGNTASGSATQLGAMMSSLLNPNESMKNALQELGFATGQAAVDQLGLVGAFNAIAGTQTAATDGMAKIGGSVETLRGVTALGNDAFTAFTTNYTTGISGATAATQAIQMEGPAAQFDLLKSKVSGLTIEVGNAFLPILADIVTQVTPVIESVIKWVKENPELTATILKIVGALTILGPIVILVGTAISAIGTIMGVVGTAGALLSGTTIPALGISFGALLAPIAAVVAILGSVILMAKSAIDFVNQVGQAAGEANAVIAPQVASGQVSKEAVFAQSFESTSGQFGGGFFGDLAARVLAPAIYNEAIKPRDFGGHGSAGTPYLIGKGAQPEMFIPDTSGTFVPNAGGGGDQISIGNINISANDRAGGMAAMNGALDAIKERQQQRGGG